MSLERTGDYVGLRVARGCVCQETQAQFVYVANGSSVLRVLFSAHPFCSAAIVTPSGPTSCFRIDVNLCLMDLSFLPVLKTI